MFTPRTKPPGEAPRRVRRSYPRWLLHGALFLAFSSSAGAVLIWPQWLAVDGSRLALQVQQERVQELNERLDVERAMKERLADWQHNTRRVYLRSEMAQYPGLVRDLAKQNGATVAAVQLTETPPARWKSVSLQVPVSGKDVAEGTDGGEIQPRAVRILLTGSFDSVYRTLGALAAQRQLFIPDRWDLAPIRGPRGARQLRAEVWASVFVVREPEDGPKLPAAPVATATRVALEGVR
jgi:hypothetical protein